jgi:predicted ferric reductase
MSTNRPGQGFWTDFSVALGFVGLALMGIEFALVARVKTVAEPFGTDALVDFHRQIGYAGLAFVLIHVALSAELRKVKSFTPAETPSRVWFGAVAAAALGVPARQPYRGARDGPARVRAGEETLLYGDPLVVLVATSVWRRQMRLSYEMWQILHAVLAVIAVVAALVHVLLVNYYVDTVWKQVLWSLMTAAFIWLLVWVRLLRPLQLRRRPWTVERIRPERDRTTVLTLRPAGHDGLRFEPGQFAWITVGRSPVLGHLPPVLVVLERRDDRQRRGRHQGRWGLQFQRRNRQPGNRGLRGRAAWRVLDRPV